MPIRTIDPNKLLLFLSPTHHKKTVFLTVNRARQGETITEQDLKDFWHASEMLKLDGQHEIVKAKAEQLEEIISQRIKEKE